MASMEEYYGIIHINEVKENESHRLCLYRIQEGG